MSNRWWIRCTVLSNSREVVVKETNEAKMLRAENSYQDPSQLDMSKPSPVTLDKVNVELWRDEISTATAAAAKAVYGRDS
ncbi:hypothetical protein YC2023_061281 [Brassica napus]